MSSISPHLQLIETIAHRFDPVQGSDEAVTYAVNDGNVKVSTPDYALVFTNWPEGPARFYLMDDDVPFQDIIPIEVIESLALADRDLDGAILAALHRATGPRNYDFITELERVRARF